MVGLKKGDRVAIMLPNLLQYPVALFGVLRAGMTVVNVNPLYTPRELEHQLKDSGAVGDRGAGELRAHAAGGDRAHPGARRDHDADRRHVPGRQARADELRRQAREEDGAGVDVAGHDGIRRARCAPGGAVSLDDVVLGPDDLAFLQYTGGTTGVAKGAMLTHGNMVANLQQVAAWIARDLEDGKEVAVIPLPLYHVFALTCSLVYMKKGARIELITNPRDIPAFVATLKKVPFTTMIGVNTLFNALLNAPGFAELDLKRAEGRVGRRHGGAACGGRALEEDDRRAAGRRLRPDRDCTGGDLQPAQHRRLDRQHRRADPVDRGGDPRRRWHARCRSARSARSASAGRR